MQGRILGGCLFTAAILAAAGASAADKKCTNPEWAPTPMPGFAISGCEERAWDSRDVDADGKTRSVSGHRVSVFYELKDPSKDPKAATAREYYAKAGQKFGAQVVQNEGYNALLRKKGPHGEAWYFYEHGSGNEDSTGTYTLTTLEEAPLEQEVVAKPVEGPIDTAGCKDPSWLVKQFSYFKRAECNNRDFDTVEFDTKDGTKKMAGRVHEIVYELADPSRDPVPMAVQRNYVAALEKIGAQLVTDPADANQAVLTQKTPQGDLWYIYRHGSGNEQSTTSYSLLTVQAGGPPPKSCKLEIYGVNFDFDKATLKPESEPVLNEVLAIFKAEPKFSGEIGGHTDDVGKRDYNMKLSAERAGAVKVWLVAHGVEAGRIRTAGYGDTRPLVPNDTDEHRAKNRRVELQRDHCTGG